MPGKKILLVDDEKVFTENMTRLLNNRGYDVTAVDRGEDALQLIEKEKYDVVILDLKMPGIDGIATLKEIKKLDTFTEILILTGHGSIDTATEALKLGAYDYLTKPLSVSNVRVICQRVIEKINLMEEIEILRKELEQTDKFCDIIGKSPQIKQIINLIKQTAASDSNVLITGESGTGKELIARAIHYYSKRNKKKFVAVNCGAIAKDLIESEGE